MLTTAVALPQRLPRSAGYLTFRVGRAEIGRYQTVGVLSFNRVLDLTRWNLSIKKARGFTGKRGGLDRLAEATWRSELGHGWCLLMALLIAAPLWFSLAGVASWLLALAVPLHIYPIMLQRVLRWRVQQLER
ncbi:hypothetical protein [Deinococcus arenicola]|uniref:Glycosyl-4,4'-diaponeurosporenoate acyltransferase n=1 Tax=Deinococcus arenicola TaxID=2994950 RepID=A0ABU4DTN3_9DEIO|nr:hypothetical protein [Deinococcus sp. ZS9-10]MDV6375034.1 hypothetical protein [Deinococcus sp. ZS9-10]